MSNSALPSIVTFSYVLGFQHVQTKQINKVSFHAVFCKNLVMFCYYVFEVYEARFFKYTGNTTGL